MAWTYPLDNATPAGSDAPSILDDRIREVKQAIQERLNADHFWPLTGTAVSDTDAGKHRKVTAQAVLGVKPTLLTGEAALYSKTVSGVSEWFWEDSAGSEHQLTNAGAINVASAEILGLIPNDTYFTAIDNAGTGQTDLIKAGQNEAADTDVAILPDKARTATDAEPLEDTALANKKYVDTKATMDPVATGPKTGFVGGESVTLPNGFILKNGSGSSTTDSQEPFTFAEAFPNACLNVQLTITDAGGQTVLPVDSVSTSQFTIDRNSSVDGSKSFYWLAIGY